MPRWDYILAAVGTLTAAAAAQLDQQLPQHVTTPQPSPITGSNPLVALAGAVVSSVLYLLQLAQYIAAAVTITVPT